MFINFHKNNLIVMILGLGTMITLWFKSQEKRNTKIWKNKLMQKLSKFMIWGGQPI